jgi:hypothetical protein
MAGFLDAIPVFNPYVQQLPVEAMVQVGMAKQKAYEENVTKIQGEIDRVAGLDIIRGVDKEYLQSKMNALGSKLNLLAGGDFSNFQLANSVGAMTKQVANDKFVQNAVSSTAWYRKQVAEMEQAMKEGKSSASNIWDFNEKANAYIQSTDLKQSFSDRYTPYTDVKKKAMDAIKALHPNLQSVDIPFEIRPDGSINVNKIADAMVRNKVEGISENQIKQAIYASFDSNDQNQLSIDGRYQFRGVTPQQLSERAKLSYESGLKDATEALGLLQVMKKTNADPNKAKFIDDQIAQYTEQIGDGKTPGKLYQSYQTNLQNIANNPDGVKAEIYKDGFVKEFANAFTWKNEERQLLTNPNKQQENWVRDFVQKKYEFEVNKGLERQRIAISQAAQNLQERRFIYEQDRNKALDQIALYGLNAPGVVGSVSTMNEDNASEVFANMLSNIQGDMNSSKATLNKLGYGELEINRFLNLLAQNKVSQIDERALPLIQAIAKDGDFLKDLQDLDANVQQKVGGKIDPAVAGTSALLRQFSGGRTIGRIFDYFTDDVRTEYNKELSNTLSNVFLPVTKAVGVDKDGKLTGNALNTLVNINNNQKKANGATINDDAFTEKNVKNTRAFVRQEGRDYKLIVVNPNVEDGEEMTIPLSQGDVGKYFPNAVNNTWNVSTRLAISPNLSTSVKLDPDRAPFKNSYIDFPNMRNININATLLQDPNNEGTFIYETFPLLKDGTRTSIRLTGKNRGARVGYEQALQLNNNLNDMEYLNMIMEQYPNFDIYSIQGVNKK